MTIGSIRPPVRDLGAVRQIETRRLEIPVRSSWIVESSTAAIVPDATARVGSPENPFVGRIVEVPRGSFYWRGKVRR